MVFSLGDMPLPNLLLDYPGEPYSKYPLDLFVCSDCTLAQLGATVPPEKMFTDYTFLTSCSAPFVKHAEDLVARMVARGAEFLNKNSLVVEIGSNDGYLLQHYKNRGIPVLGIDPAGPPAMNAQILHGITTLQMYFTNELAEKIVAGRGQVEVIHANNVLAHVPDVNDFVKGIKTLLKPEGVAIVEIPNAEYLTFDQIYHEHVFYFTPLSLTRLFERHGLWVTSFEGLDPRFRVACGTSCGGSCSFLAVRLERIRAARRFGAQQAPGDADAFASVQDCRVRSFGEGHDSS
jgi:SAM-dependent methyltransferase